MTTRSRRSPGPCRCRRPRRHADARASADRLAGLGRRHRGAAVGSRRGEACASIACTSSRRSASRRFLDPCPIDLGRDVEFTAEVAQATGVHIICATGLYKEDPGAAPYFKFRGAFTDAVSEMTETFIKELTDGIGSTGIKAGIIKVATGPHQITPYEKIGADRRGARPQGDRRADHDPHRRGHDGPRAARHLRRRGRRSRRASSSATPAAAPTCATTSTCSTAACYLGFDRFGLEILQPDRLRLAALIGLLGIGFERQIVLVARHRVVLARPPAADPGRDSSRRNGIRATSSSTSSRRCAKPASSQAKIDAMLIDNPRRYFEGQSKQPMLDEEATCTAVSQRASASEAHDSLVPTASQFPTKRAAAARSIPASLVREARARPPSAASGYRERSLALHGWICAKCAREFEANERCICSPSITRTAIITTIRPTAATGRTCASTATKTNTAARCWPIICAGARHARTTQ